MTDFTKRQIAVTLTGEQWFTLIAKLSRHPLSPRGEKIYVATAESLESQVRAASDDSTVELAP